MEKLVIYGNGAIARGMYRLLENDSNYEVVAFTVDRESLNDDRLCGFPVVPFEIVQDAFPPNRHKMLIAVGYVENNKIRRDRYLLSKEMGYELPNFISPTVSIHSEIQIGDSCNIGDYSVIFPTAKIGNNVSIGPGCFIGEDVVVGDHCFLSAGVAIAGYVSVGSCAYLGLRSVIRNKVSIGNDCVIGAGAVMLENAENGSVYMGEPATLLPISSDELTLG